MPTITPPGGGEVVGDSPDRRVEILSDVDALHATWSRFGPRRDGADLHIHRRHTDLFYVLAGSLTVRLGAAGDAVAARAGTLVRVPPLVVHGFRNDADAELRYLNFHAPGVGFAAYMRALRDGRTLAYDQYPPPPDGGRPVTEAVVGEPVCAGGGEAMLSDVEAIAIAELRRASSRPHVHRRHVESIYVLEGELAVTAGGRSFQAAAGSWVQLPPGLPHTVSSSGPVRFLDVHTPSCRFGAFLRAQQDAGDEQLAAARTSFDQQPAR